jgi:hypothetical protein
MTRRPTVLAPVVAVLVALGAASVHPVPAADGLRVRTNLALAACLRPALQAFERESRIATLLEVGEPDPPRGADVVVGDDSEMTRLLEGGVAELTTSFDLGYLPWVTVVPRGTPADSLSASATGPVWTLGGAAGREARESLRELGDGRVHVSRNEAELHSAQHALVPRSLAGPGEHRPAAVRPLIATVALVPGSPRHAAARQLLAFLRSEKGHAILAASLDPEPSAVATPPLAAASAQAARYAASIVDWWLPQCSLDHNGYNDRQQVLGAPDAANLGGKDRYRGIMSLGQGGYVSVDMGEPIVDHAGADVRVFQATSGEPVTLYAASSPEGPFVLVGLQERCGVRTPGLFSNHCDFDLRAGGLSEARYLKIEDGEIYPCLSGGTITEGADIDAVQALGQP